MQFLCVIYPRVLLFCLGLFAMVSWGKAQEIPATDTLVAYDGASHSLYQDKFQKPRVWKTWCQTQKRKPLIKAWKAFKAKGDGTWTFYKGKSALFLPFQVSEFKWISPEEILFKSRYLWGMMDVKGNIKIAPKYKSLVHLQDGRWQGKLYPVWEFRDRQKKLIQTFSADQIQILDSNHIGFQVEGHWGLMDVKTQAFLRPAQYESMIPFADSLLIVSEGGGKGAINYKGGVVLSNVYDSIRTDTLGLIRLGKKIPKDSTFSWQWGLANKQGKILVPIKFDEIRGGTENLFPVKKSSQWGYYDVRGIPAIPVFYESVGLFHEGKAWVVKNGKTGVLDKEGRWYLFPEFDQIISLNDSTWIKKTGKEYQFFVPGTAKYASKMYSLLEPLGSHHFVYQEKKTLKGVLNHQCKKLIAPNFDAWQAYTEAERLLARKAKQWFIFDEKGKLITKLPSKIDSIYTFQEGMFWARMFGRSCFLDKDGSLLIAPQYDQVQGFHQGLCGVRIGARWGYIDVLEKFVISPTYDTVCAFDQNIAMVCMGKLWGFVNTSGQEIIKPSYSSIQVTPFQNYVVRQNQKLGLVNKKGVEVVNPVYDFMEDLGYGLLKVRYLSKFGIIDYKNRPVVSIHHDDVHIDVVTGYFVGKTVLEPQILPSQTKTKN